MAVAAGQSVVTFCVLIVAEQPMQLPLLVVRQAQRGMQRVGKGPACVLCRPHCRRPVPAGLLELRPVHQTLPRKGTMSDCERPCGKRIRPFGGPAQIVEIHAPEDHPAVHDSSGDRAHFVGGDRNHGVVESGDSRVRLTHRDQCLGMRECAERAQVRVIEPVGDLGRADRHLECLGGVPVVNRGEAARNENVARSSTLRTRIRCKRFSAGEPTAGRRRLAPQHQAETEPEGVAGGLGKVTGAARRMQRRLPVLGIFVVSAEQIRADRRPL